MKNTPRTNLDDCNPSQEAMRQASNELTTGIYGDLANLDTTCDPFQALKNSVANSKGLKAEELPEDPFAEMEAAINQNK